LQLLPEREREMKQGKGHGGGSKLGRWLGAPVRALSRACDSYVRRMTACAGRMPTTHAGAMGGRGGFAPGMQAAATFSSRSRRDQDDVDALVRAMSRRQQASARRAGEGAGGVAVPVRSRSMAVVGRIDEDAPCEFGPGGGPAAVRRARSVAVGSAGRGFGAAKKSAMSG
jgi:hypothetical protein